MGRGGKKKSKADKTEKDKVDLDVVSLSLSDSEPSTSLSSSSKPPEESKKPEAAIEESKPSKAAPQEEVDDDIGLGLGTKSKKRPRKKKKGDSEKESTPAPEQMQGIETTSRIDVSTTSPTQPLATSQTFVQPAPQLAPQMAPQPAPQPAPQRAPQRAPQSAPQSAGRGRGRGWNTVSQTAPTPTFTPPLPSQTPQPASAPAPSTFQTSLAGPAPRGGLGRGRGQPGYQPESNVSVTTPARSKPSDTVCRFKIPERRPGKIVASQSRFIKVLTNYLEMTIQPLKIHRYDVSIKPDRPKKLVPKAFAAAKAKSFPKHIIAYDQKKNCFSVSPLWSHSDERSIINVEVVDDNEAKMSFEITIKFTGIVDLGTIINHMQKGGSSLNPPMEAIQCIDVILQQGTLENYVKAGRQFFKQPRNPIDLSYGLEMWTGLFQSAIFTSRAFINIDVAHKGFPRNQSLVDALVRDFRLDPSKPLDKQRGVDYFIQFLKGLRVTANLAGSNKKREYICNSIVDPPNRLTFPMTDSAGKTRNITVDKYFEEKNCRLRYPHLNCMWVGPRDKKIYYPMELLEVSYGQALNKQLNENQLRTMVREAATPPSDRMNKIKEVIHNMNYSANPCFKHFKMEVSDQFLRVDAKVLPAPKLDIGAGRTVEPRKGAWQANRFLKASALTSWGLIAIEVDVRRCDCQRIVDMTMRVGGTMGMAVCPPKFSNFYVKMNDVRKVLMTANEEGVNMMIIIIPGRYKDAYNKIKCTAELEVGILTQCIKENTAACRMSEQTIRNILLKINSKLMGVNQALESRSIPQCIREGGVMVVGADVTHPSPDQSNIPSIAAVTASIDPKCFIYNIELSIQTPKHEIIVEFEDMMFDHLKVYKSEHNSLPKKIFVFRDGVSEGQFAQVMNSELVAVQKAYSRLEQRFKPEILFLLVQKRHHTRFFLGDNNPQNVEPGTVVDTDIVHSRELDFYLVSHQAIKGTARPTRYHVVCNDGNIPSDEVEQLAYYLCHLYARCTRSVSYPAPTYYAHLACLRARALTSERRFINADLEKKPQRLHVLDRMLQNSRMFFV